MPTELEQAIRSALRARADAVAPRLARPRPAARGRRTSLLVAATVLVVLAIAVPLAVWRGTSHTAPAGGDAGYVGYRWQVVGAVDGQGRLVLPVGPPGLIEYGTDGIVTGIDTVNALRGRYERISGGYSVSDVETTYGKFSNKDPARGRLIEDIDAVFVEPWGLKQGMPATSQVAVHVTGDILTLRAGTVTLTLARVSSAETGGAPQATTLAPRYSGP